MSSYLYCATERGIEEHIRDGESCRICKDWIKAGKPVTLPAGEQPAKRKTKRPAKCGTISGYQRHYNQKETPCDACKAAKSRYNRELYGAKDKPSPEELNPCGTPPAYLRHKRRGEEPCEPCREAFNSATRARQAAKRRAKGIEPRIKPREHGSMTGYRQHLKHKETVCDPCRDAYNKVQREIWDNVRARKTAEQDKAA